MPAFCFVVIQVYDSRWLGTPGGDGRPLGNNGLLLKSAIKPPFVEIIKRVVLRVPFI